MTRMAEKASVKLACWKHTLGACDTAPVGRPYDLAAMAWDHTLTMKPR